MRSAWVLVVGGIIGLVVLTWRQELWHQLPDTPVAAQSASGSPNSGDDSGPAMPRIRDLVTRDPAAALALIDWTSTTGSEPQFAEERTALRIEALVRIGEKGQAHDTAEQFLEHYPKSQFAGRVHSLTGAMPPDEEERDEHD
jgi:hypothetical protein